MKMSLSMMNISLWALAHVCFYMFNVHVDVLVASYIKSDFGYMY